MIELYPNFNHGDAVKDSVEALNKIHEEVMALLAKRMPELQAQLIKKHGGKNPEKDDIRAAQQAIYCASHDARRERRMPYKLDLFTMALEAQDSEEVG